jgi:MFS family permease
MDEASFVLGPVLVGVLTTFIAPWAPLVIGAALTATVVTAFALHPSGQALGSSLRPPSESRERVLSRPVVLLAAGMLLVGAAFGSILTVLTAFMSVRGAGEQTGIVYGAMSVGAFLVAVSVALACATSVGGMIAALLLSGVGIGAVLVSLFSLGTNAAPEGRSTTVLTTLQSTLVVGQALATAAAGLVAQSHGATAGFAISVAAVVALVALAAFYRLRFGTG